MEFGSTTKQFNFRSQYIWTIPFSQIIRNYSLSTDCESFMNIKCSLPTRVCTNNVRHEGESNVQFPIAIMIASTTASIEIVRRSTQYISPLRDSRNFVSSHYLMIITIFWYWVGIKEIQMVFIQNIPNGFISMIDTEGNASWPKNMINEKTNQFWNHYLIFTVRRHCSGHNVNIQSFINSKRAGFWIHHLRSICDRKMKYQWSSRWKTI